MNDILMTSPMIACGSFSFGPLVLVLLGALALWIVSAFLAIANFALVGMRQASATSMLRHLGWLLGCAAVAPVAFNGKLDGIEILVAIGVPILVIGQFCYLLRKKRTEAIQ